MRTFVLASVLGAALTGLVCAQTSYPMISHVSPVAVQRGKTTTVVVSGTQNLAGVYQALFEGTGITAKVVSSSKAPAKGVKAPPRPKGVPVLRSVTLELTVAASAALGVREFRLVSNIGLSSIGQLVISDDPVVVEKGDNNTREKAPLIATPCMVAGVIEVAEDVDFYRFRARAGQTFSFDVQCARIQDKIHDLQKHADPILSLYDSAGRELAANDDFYFADPYLSYTFKQDGEYLIQIRDSKYDGDPRWVYALLVSDRPYASHVYPMAAQAGKPVELEPVGSAGLIRPKVRLTAPEKIGVQDVQLDTGSGLSYPVPLLVSDLPQVLETEPNDTPETATKVTLPCGINGRIGKPRDLDHFAFTAKRGQSIRFEVKARRFGTDLRSSLDSVLEVLNAKGAIIGTNDDATGKDAALTFNPPADGSYILRIRDLNSKGGPSFIYHIDAQTIRPDFVLKCDGDKAMIGPGSRTAWFVQLTRVGSFTGPVKVEMKGLPQGITVSPLTLQPGQTQGVLVISATPDAKQTAGIVSVVGTAVIDHAGKQETVTHAVEPNQEIYFPGGGRGVFPVNMQAVAVTEPSDILEVVVQPTEIVLQPGKEVKIEVEVKRSPNYDKSVTIDILLRHLGRVFGNPLPTGVTIVEGKSKTLLGTGSKGHIVLKAAPTAPPIEGAPICVLTHVSINFVVKVSYSSQPILLSVRK